LCDTPDGIQTILPIALIERTVGGSLGLARFRFDAQGTSATSVGGASETVFAFEFLTPPDSEVREIFVKGIRLDVSADTSLPESSFASTNVRDDAILGGTVFASFGIAATGAPAGPIDRTGSQSAFVSKRGGIDGVRVEARLPYNIRLQSSIARRRLELNTESEILSGTSVFDESDFAGLGTDRKLVVDKIKAPRDTAIVSVEVAANGRKSIFGRSMDTAERVVPPVLVDTNGTRYQAIGYVLKEGEKATISINPAQPIRALSAIPSLSSTKSQSLTLIFTPDVGVTITGFLLGNREVVNFGANGILVK